MQVDKTEVHILPNGDDAPGLRGHVAFGIMDHLDSDLRWLNFDCRIEPGETTTHQAQKLALIQDAKRQLLRMPEYRLRGEQVHFSDPLPVDA